MRFAQDFESHLTFEDMSGGLRGLSERIAREVPRRAPLILPASINEIPADFARAAQCLHDFEHGLDGLWPEE